MGNIYLLQNKITKDNYIGKTINTIEKRFNQHIANAKIWQTETELNIPHKCKSRLYPAIVKYGIDNFEIYELETNIGTVDDLNKREKFWIKYYRSIGQAAYNIADGGDGGDLFSCHTEEEKAKIRAKLSVATAGENNPMYGKHHTEEAKDLIRKSYTPERLKHYKDINTGENNPMWQKEPWNKGLIQTQEFKDKCRAANTGQNNNNFGNRYADAFNHRPVILIKPDGTQLEFSCKLECSEYLGYQYNNVPINKVINSTNPKRNGCIVKYTDELNN